MPRFLKTKTMVALMFLFMPLCVAAETGAMLYVKGQARVNGGTVPGPSAIFAGDIIQTDADSAANINALGSNIVISPKSAVTFESNAVDLQQGAVMVATSNGTAVRAGDLTITPAHSSMTQFEISDADGVIHVVARKGDLSVSDPAGTTQLNEGQETTRTEPKSKKRSGGAVPGGQGPILSATTYEAAGAAAAGALVVYYLSQDRTPASPIKP